uniref:Protein containing C-type lectin domain protein n=1 Tax=uncultured organism TaxID=155900 RepID=M1P1R6_9ZZZZ|nr:protein containing C-type lectin domain protein [uncultured organism]
MNFNKRLFRIEDEEGVSEIVGTILTLSITVVLFTSIFAGVQYLETPEGTTFTEFNATYDKNYNITVEHSGGKDLDTDKTSLFVVFNDKSYKFDFGSDEVTLFGKDPSEWITGEKVKLNISDLSLSDVDFVDLLVMDTVRSQVIWQTEVDIYSPQKGPQIKNYGPIYPQEWDDYVEAGEKCKLFVEVDYDWDKIGEVDVLVNLGKLTGFEDKGAWSTGWFNITDRSGYRFIKKNLEIDDNQDNGTYLLEIIATNASADKDILKDFVKNGNKDSSVSWSGSEYIGLNIGPKSDTTKNPNIAVKEITFVPASPTNGDSLTTRVLIENRGGTYVEFDIYFNETLPDGTKEPRGYLPNNTIAAGGGQDFSATWTVNKSGKHNISVETANIFSPGGEELNPDNNYLSKDVYVAPTILLVDDDHTKNGDASKMEDALEGSDFSFEYYEVKGRDGAPYDKMKNYDIVIWMTGKTRNATSVDNFVLEQPTLTETDQNNLNKYLNKNNMLWLIGEGFAEDPVTGSLKSKIGSPSLSSDSFPNPGIDNDYRINGTGLLENTTYPVFNNNEYHGDEIISSKGEFMILNDEGGDAIGTNYSYDKSGTKYKVAFNSFLFSSMRAGHSTMAYNVIKWLGNMTEKSGRDLAVSDSEISNKRPRYQETITIEATIRNNGQFDETTDVALFVDGQLDPKKRKTISVNRSGDYEDVVFEWTADSLGQHELLVKVDPFNKIRETNELNNDIRYQGYTPTTDVQFSVMVVDDDGSGDENLKNTTEKVTNQLVKLRYPYDYVNMSLDWEDTKDYLENISDYNSVFWITGNNKDDLKLLEDDNVSRIEGYLDEQGNFFLEGNNVFDELSGSNSDFLENYLGIDTDVGVVEKEGLKYIKGRNKDNLSHGLDYDMGNSSYQEFDPKSDLEGAHSIFKYKDQSVGVKYYNRENEYKTVSLGFDLANITKPSVKQEWFEGFKGKVNTSDPGPAREEFIFMLTKWFGNEDQVTELRIAEEDIDIEVKNPMLGKSYLVTAKIQNIGYNGSSVLVRVMDGDSLIASESFYIEGNSDHSIEVNWEPLFAGYNKSKRNITVLVDPLRETREIGNNGTSQDDMDFNNVDVKRVPVFYFWDDMESETRNWRHESVLANINGESPIDYLGEGYENVYTDIQSDWDRGMSKGLNTTNYTSHTNPTSYWLTEPKARNESKEESKPIDVVMAIDTSGSMNWDDEGNNVGADNSNSRMYQAVEAAMNFIGKMNKDDRVEIWTFDPNGGIYPDPYLYREFAYMTDDNKDYFNESLIDIREGEGDFPYGPTGNTPYYDTLGHAIQSAIDINDGGNEDRLEFVIGLADGEDNTGNEYSPTEEWGEGGLLNAPPMVYNIGLVGNALHPDDSTYPEAPQWNNTWEDYDGDQIEKEMFDVGNKTPTWDKYGKRKDDAEYGPTEKGDPYTGRYYFAEKAEDVGTVFEEVRKIITTISEQQAEEGNVTSIDSIDDNSLMATQVVFEDDFDDGNNNGWTVSGSGGIVGVNQDTYLSPSYSQYTSGGYVSTSSPTIDLNTYSSASFKCWIRRGDDSFSENPDSGENLIVSYQDNSGSWQSLEQFAGGGTPGEIYQRSYDLPNDALHSNFRIRFEQIDGSDGYDYWHFDNIIVETSSGGGQDEPPYIVYTSPTDKENNVSVRQKISVVFSKPMNTDSVSYNCNPDPGGWAGSWGSNDQVLTLSHDKFEYKTTYTVEITDGEDKSGNPLESSAGSHGGQMYNGNEYKLITNDMSWSDAKDYCENQGGHLVTITSSEENSFVQNLINQDVWIGFTDQSSEGDFEWVTGETVSYTNWAPGEPNDWGSGEDYTQMVTDGEWNDYSGTNNLAFVCEWEGSDSAPNPWSFTTISEGQDGEESHLAYGKNYNKTLVTNHFNLSNYDSAQLTFWHKYKIVPGTNGGFLQLGYNVSGEWKWEYIVPSKGSYTGNMNMSENAQKQRKDDFGRTMNYAYNGVSRDGTFGWD